MPLRRLARALVVVLGLVSTTVAQAQPAPPARSTRKDDLARARTLDEQGVRAYKEGRYNDAILLFYEAYRLGGPPSELWNVAKCHLRLDQPEEANDAIEQYLTLPGLTDDDRKEAQTQLQDLRARQSTLTITSNPPGASVLVDRKATDGTSKTPISVRVPPGTHSVSVELADHATFNKEVEARFGRAIVVDVELTRTRKDGAVAPPPPPNPYRDSAMPRWGMMAQLGALFPRYGAQGDTASAAGLFRGTYRVIDGPTSLALGVRLTVVGDAWTSRNGQPNASPTCNAVLPNNFTGTALAFFAVAAIDRKLLDRVRGGVDLGVGFAAFFGREVGGDLFFTSCRPSPGIKPALHIGLEASYAFAPAVRAIVSPLVFEAHPAFDGVRATTPYDATGMWYRAGFGLGLAVDL